VPASTSLFPHAFFHTRFCARKHFVGGAKTVDNIVIFILYCLVAASILTVHMGTLKASLRNGDLTDGQNIVPCPPLYIFPILV
jgi:hypothetical protein